MLEKRLCGYLEECLRAKIECELSTIEEETHKWYAEDVDDIRQMLFNFNCGKWKITESDVEKKTSLTHEQIRKIAKNITECESGMRKHGFCALCVNFDDLGGSCCYPNGSCTEGVVDYLKAVVSKNEKQK